MAGTNQVFENVGNVTPDRNMFNLSHTVKFDARFGELIPIMCKQVVPGDVVRLNIEQVIRMQPSFVPFNHEIDIKYYSFFVPYRILDKASEKGRFESVISGGLKGQETRDFYRLSDIMANAQPLNDKHSISDYLGLVPPGISYSGSANTTFGNGILTRMLAYPYLAYNRIYLDYFADENLEDDKFTNSEGLFDNGNEWMFTNTEILLGNWDKDYFTSALPFQQRGTAPALPISGVAPVTLSGDLSLNSSNFAISSPMVTVDGSNRNIVAKNVSSSPVLGYSGAGASVSANVGSLVGSVTGLSLNNDLSASVNFEDASTFNVTDMRYAFQLQKFMERNARAGVRYTEFVKSHFGISPTDARLDRAEYCGGTVGHVAVSEVLQQSSGTESSELGQYAGHGISAFRDDMVDSYHVEEFGCFMVLMVIKPSVGYMQGIPREWLYGDRYEWYFPEFAHLSEQAIKNCELFVDANSSFDGETDSVGNDADDIFGYQGIYDELRVAYDRVSGDLRDTMDYWHLARKFASQPQLSEDFIKINPVSDDLNRVFNYEGTADNSAYPFICAVGFNLSMLRPLPFIPEPGLIDHF